MRTQHFVIQNKLGLHARPCAQLAKTASFFKSSVTLTQKDRTVDAKSILGLMSMAMPFGSDFTITVEGVDEERAMTEIAKLIETRFGEEN